MSREVEESDTFHFNDLFQSKLFKIKIGTITAQKETEPEKLETRQKVRFFCHFQISFWGISCWCYPEGTT